MSRFKASNGLHLTQKLFLELSYHDTEGVIYTLKDQDHRGYPSLYRLYMEMEDLTEYEFANAHLDGWKHWEQITSAPWFRPYIVRWRKELELKIKARALRAIMAEAAADTKYSFAANRYLVDKGWVERPEGKRGRPSSKEIIDFTLKQEDIDKDLERITVQ